VIASQIRRAPQGADQRGQVPWQRRGFLVLGLVLTRTRVLAHTRSVERRQPEGHKHHAAAFAAMKWPALAAHSRAGLAETLATVKPALTRAAPARPPAAQLRTALYQHAFNPARTGTADPATNRVLAWAQQASLPVTLLADPMVLRRALDALTLRLDGSRAAANTITRKRAVFHGALGYAVEAGLLKFNPADSITWQVPKAATTVDPKVVASPAQAEVLLAAVAGIRPAFLVRKPPRLMRRRCPSSPTGSSSDQYQLP
jgi:hypothetical protein